MNIRIAAPAIGALAVIGAVWALTGGGGGKLSASLKASLGGGTDPAPSDGWGAMRTGRSPGTYGAPCPTSSVRDAIGGAHPLKNHPKVCSPGMGAAMKANYDWMFTPPSEDDL